jgi:hypothetical protein
MMVGEFFDLNEFTVSQSAARAGISNNPPEEVINRIKEVCKVLDDYRRRSGKPIIITSGYRSPKVNKLIGGAKNSQHVLGEAADFIVPGVSVAEVVKQIREFGIKFDQLIDEFGEWIHISYRASGNRGEVLTARKVKGKTVYKKAV